MTDVRVMDVAHEGWWERAACRGQDAGYFFAPSWFESREEKRGREAVAKAICGRCPVRDACLEHALAARDPHGVWGGQNESERRTILRERDAESDRRAS